MPVYNSGRFLCESLDSILGQTLKEFELIIIDDNSTDDSLQIIKKYKERDVRIKIIENKTNIGPARSRNAGIKKSAGKYIAILDSDDVCMRKRLEVEYNYLENHSDIYLVGSSAIFIDESGVTLRRYRKFNNPDIISWRLPKSCGIIHSSVMFRNNRVSYYDPRYHYAHDYNLYLELLKRGKKLTNLPQFLIKYRVSPNAISFSKRTEQAAFRDLIQQKYSNMNRNLPLLKKIYFSALLGLFYIRTFFEKNKASLL